MDRERWIALMQALGLPSSPEVYDRLREAYAEKHRHHHTAEHVRDALAEMDRVKSLLERPAEVELAIWFHDAIYDTHQEDGEERSALWVETFLTEAGAPDEVVRRVGALVRATAHFEEGPLPEGDAAYLVDVDLAILGRPTAEFDLYELRIRREYSWVPEEEYCDAREDVLIHFLEREEIYLTPFFRERYEQRARTNLQRMLEVLGE